ncbi:MAG: hypothetical protein ACRDJG_05930 [Actinomycetota bacterium]
MPASLPPPLLPELELELELELQLLQLGPPPAPPPPPPWQFVLEAIGMGPGLHCWSAIAGPELSNAAGIAVPITVTANPINFLNFIRETSIDGIFLDLFALLVLEPLLALELDPSWWWPPLALERSGMGPELHCRPSAIEDFVRVSPWP